MMASLIGAAAIAVAAPSPALTALGLGALPWRATAEQIERVVPSWAPDSDRHTPTLTPGRVALITLGGCAFHVSFEGARGVLTHVGLRLHNGEREACAQEIKDRLTAALGAPRPSNDMRSTYAVQEPFWDGVGETASLIDWGPPINQLAAAATAAGDETVTVR